MGTPSNYVLRPCGNTEVLRDCHKCKWFKVYPDRTPEQVCACGVHNWRLSFQVPDCKFYEECGGKTAERKA